MPTSVGNGSGFNPNIHRLSMFHSSAVAPHWTMAERVDNSESLGVLMKIKNTGIVTSATPLP